MDPAEIAPVQALKERRPTTVGKLRIFVLLQSLHTKFFKSGTATVWTAGDTSGKEPTT